MTRYRDSLPHLAEGLFLTDGDLPATLVADERLELRGGVAYPLLDRKEGREVLRTYYRRYAALARAHGLGLVAHTPTAHATPGAGRLLGYSAVVLRDLNRRAVQLVASIRRDQAAGGPPLMIAGQVAPRLPGTPSRGSGMSVDQAMAYHAQQIGALAASETDLISASPLGCIDEAIGIACAARATGVPVVLGFRLGSDGRLPTGESLGEAIEAVDEATDWSPAYYAAHCASPAVLDDVLMSGEAWIERLACLRVPIDGKAAACGSATADASPRAGRQAGPDGAAHLAALHGRLPHINVLGGCCGADHRTLDRIVRACAPGSPGLARTAG